jgi:hypothetical protein
MKKLAAISSGISYLFVSATSAFAQIQVQHPGVGYRTINDFINAALRLAFIIALVLVLVMMVWGAVEWIFSGGNKDAVGNARNRIIHALVGLAILAVAFALVTLAGQFVGIDLLRNFTIPSPSNPTPSLQ